jgi:DNA-directed RNA polymerase specialized sigma24 family protein
MTSDPVRRGSVDALRTALSTLPAKQRDVYLLAARDGLPLERIGRILGMEPAEVIETLGTALGAIDRNLNPE